MKVTLHVYDIMTANKYVDCLGIGAYHTGVEVGGVEYAYGGNTLVESTGVYEMMPKSHDVFLYKCSYEMGEIHSKALLWQALTKLKKKYRANQYDMLKRNCNHFTNELLIELVGRTLPRHLNRAAYTLSFLHCLVPTRFLVVTPATQNYDIVLPPTSHKSGASSGTKYGDTSSEDDIME